MKNVIFALLTTVLLAPLAVAGRAEGRRRAYPSIHRRIQHWRHKVRLRRLCQRRHHHRRRVRASSLDWPSRGSGLGCRV